MGDPSPGLIAAVVAVLISASVVFSLFEQALKVARKPGLLKHADDAEKRAQAKRRGTVSYLRETRRAEMYRRVLAVVENSDRHLFITGFWIYATRIPAVVLLGLDMRLGVAHTAVFVAVIVVAFLVMDHMAKGVARFTPERIAATLLTTVNVFSLPLLPFIFLARKLGRLLRWIFPPKTDREGMTEDELRHALIEGEKSGIVESSERAMVEGVLYLGDRPLGVFMTSFRGTMARYKYPGSGYSGESAGVQNPTVLPCRRRHAGRNHRRGLSGGHNSGHGLRIAEGPCPRRP